MSQFTRRTSTLAGADFTQALHPETYAPLEGDEACTRARCRRICRAYRYKGGYCRTRRICRCYGRR